METHLCQNCGNEYTESYCNRCGQKTVHRISLSHIAHDALHAFTHADKGIIHLFLQLFIRPGIVAREFIIEGKRKKYFNPVQYLLIIASIATLVVASTHMMDKIMEVNPMAPASGATARQLEFTKTTMAFLGRYFNIVLILQLPFFSLASYLVYKKHKLLYAEHLALHIFITAQVTVISTIILSWIISDYPRFYTIFSTLIGLVYTMFAYMQFFKDGRMKGGLRAFFAYLFGYVFYLIFLGIVTAITVAVFLIVKKAGNA